MKICEPSRPAQCGHATHTTANKSTKASHQNSLLPPLLFSIVVNSGSAGVCRASGPHSFSPLFFFLSYLILITDYLDDAHIQAELLSVLHTKQRFESVTTVPALRPAPAQLIM